MSDDTFGRRASVSIYNTLLRIPGIGGILPKVSSSLLKYQFTRDLVKLNDVLGDSGLADRYWVFSGMLLGWAREGAMLPNATDADFGILLEDVDALLKSVPKLLKAGFRPFKQCRTNDGQLVEFMFCRRRAIYDFSVFFSRPDGLHYFVFGWPPDQLYEVEKVLPSQDKVPFEFLRRTWLRHADYELELELNYGDWRTPQRDWNYLRDGPNTIRIDPWTNTDTSWRD